MRAKRVWKSISTWQWARSNRRIRRLSTGSASNGHPTIQNHWPVRLLVLCWNLTNITNTLSSLPRKTAQLPLVAAMARTCTSTTGLLILLVSSLAFPPRSELLSTGDQEPKPSRFAPHPLSKIRSARVSGHRSKGMRVRPPNLHSRMSDRRLVTISCAKSRLERLFFSLAENTLFPPM